MKYDEVDHYSIWLESENINCPHKKAIDTISEVARTTKFTPHITLVGNIERWDVEVIQNKIERLAENTETFDVNFGHIFTGPNWLNVIMILANRNQNITRLRLRAKKIFNKSSLLYLPHMSLLYGEASHGIKKGIVKRLKEDGILKHPFTIKHISLWHCSNGVANWRRITSVELRPPLK